MYKILFPLAALATLAVPLPSHAQSSSHHESSSTSCVTVNGHTECAHGKNNTSCDATDDSAKCHSDEPGKPNEEVRPEDAQPNHFDKPDDDDDDNASPTIRHGDDADKIIASLVDRWIDREIAIAMLAGVPRPLPVQSVARPLHEIRIATHESEFTARALVLRKDHVNSKKRELLNRATVRPRP